MVQRRRWQRGLDGGRRQPAAHQPGRGVRAEGRPRAAGVRPAAGHPGHDRPLPHGLVDGLPEPAELPGAAVRDRFGCELRDPEFDALLAKGNAAATNAEAIGFYNQAEDVVLEDMPIIPLFFAVTQSVHSADVTDVVVDVFGRVDTSALTEAADLPSFSGKENEHGGPHLGHEGAAVPA